MSRNCEFYKQGTDTNRCYSYWWHTCKRIFQNWNVASSSAWVEEKITNICQLLECILSSYKSICNLRRYGLPKLTYYYINKLELKFAIFLKKKELWAARSSKWSPDQASILGPFEFRKSRSHKMVIFAIVKQISLVVTLWLGSTKARFFPPILTIS